MVQYLKNFSQFLRDRLSFERFAKLALRHRRFAYIDLKFAQIPKLFFSFKFSFAIGPVDTACYRPSENS